MSKMDSDDGIRKAVESSNNRSLIDESLKPAPVKLTESVSNQYFYSRFDKVLTSFLK